MGLFSIYICDIAVYVHTHTSVQLGVFHLTGLVRAAQKYLLLNVMLKKRRKTAERHTNRQEEYQRLSFLSAKVGISTDCSIVRNGFWSLPWVTDGSHGESGSMFVDRSNNLCTKPM